MADRKRNETPETPENPNANAPATTEAVERTPKGQSINARAKASLKAIVDLLAAGQKVGADVLKTAADIVAEFPLAGSGISSALPLPEQLKAVEQAISDVFSTPDLVQNGKIARNEDKEEQLRILLDKKRRIKAAIKKANAPKTETAGA